MISAPNSNNTNILWIKNKEEHHENHIHSFAFLSNKRADPKTIHTCVLQIKPKTGGISKLEQILSDISDPNSPNYGKYLSKAQVEDLTANKKGKLIVENYLISSGVNISKSSSDYITGDANITVWESILNNEFFETDNFYYKDSNGKKVFQWTVTGERTVPIDKCDYDYDHN
jgi:subtilase family serine protease